MSEVDGLEDELVLLLLGLQGRLSVEGFGRRSLRGLLFLDLFLLLLDTHHVTGMKGIQSVAAAPSLDGFFIGLFLEFALVHRLVEQSYLLLVLSLAQFDYHFL
uniref:Uncharacterized protein n=1 Tax=Strombidium inclinatum TaxID=197538 RepID=A0A7S3IH25_9SPIT